MNRAGFRVTVIIAALLAAVMLSVPSVSGAMEDFSGKQGLWTAPGSLVTGARPAAIGGLYSCIADDVSAVHWNPAGLATLEGIEMALHHTALPVDGSQEEITFGGPLWSSGAVGAAFRYAAYGPVEVTDESGNRSGDFTPWDFATTVGAAHDIAGGLLAGGALTVGRRTLAEDCKIDDFSGSAGFLWAGGEYLKIAGTARNIGASVKGSPRPISYTVGMAGLVEDRDVQLTLGMAVEIVPGGANAIHLGAEDRIMGRYFLRGGYAIRLGDAGDDAQGGLGCGLGARLASFRLDYAYLPLGRLGGVHQVSLGYGFGRWISTSTTAPVTPPPAESAPAVTAIPPAGSLSSTAIDAGRPVLTLAVADLSPLEGTSATEAVAASEWLRGDLAAARYLKVTGREDMQKALVGQSVTVTGCAEQECAVRLGKVLGVQRMIVGKSGRFLDGEAMRVQVVDVGTGQVVYADDASGKTREEIVAAVRTMAVRIDSNTR